MPGGERIARRSSRKGGGYWARLQTEWEHKQPPEDGHSADGHYSADGKWVCFKCRKPVEAKE